MITLPTLIIQTAYFPSAVPEQAHTDPERLGAEALAEELYELLTRPLSEPLAWGAGIPVFASSLGSEIATNEAQHVVVIPVLGQEAFTQFRQDTLDAMTQLVKRGARVFPVLTHGAWRQVESKMPKPILADRKEEPNSRRFTLNEILLALARVLSRNERYSSQVFISHAKADIDQTGNAAEQVRAWISGNSTGTSFFDKVSILPGEELTEQIDRAAERGVFIAIRGDKYSSRTWCRRELLHAKQKRLPTLVVEVLSTGEARSAAYAGNGPTVVWDRSASSGAGAGRVVTLAMVECVRHLFFMEESRRVIEAAGLPPSTERVARHPELVDVAAMRALKDSSLVVIHPDPPLPPFEHALLQEAERRLRPVTPTTAFASAVGSSIRAPLEGWQVALSISDRLGQDTRAEVDRLAVEHLNDMTVFLARCLVGMGSAIAYGGDFRAGGFTPLLSRLVTEYNETARRDPEFLHSYLGATIPPGSGGDLAYEAHWTPRSKHDPLAAPSGPVSSARAAIFFSDMRRVMAIETSARVIIGGTEVPRSHAAKGYGGRFPGVVEEAWRTLQLHKPLYVLGGFGGAAKLVVEALENDQVPELLRDAKWADRQEWRSLAEQIDGDSDAAKLGLPKSQEELANWIRTFGQQHLQSDETSRAWNGLTLAENRTLFRTRDPLTATALVARGLLAVSTRSAQGKLRVELVEGDAVQASGLDVLVFPTFTDVAIDGVGAAIDRATGDAATRARQTKRIVVSASTSFGADYLYAADLGPVGSALADGAAAARRAAEATAVVLRGHGFKRVGIVTFLGNAAPNLGEVVVAMATGLRQAAEGSEFVWFELDPTRAAIIAHALESMADTAITRRASPTPLSSTPNRSRTVVAVRYENGRMDVTLLFHRANGLAPVVSNAFDEVQRSALIGAPNSATPAKWLLDTVGDRVSSLLFGQNAPETLDAVRSSELVILHDRQAGGIPYETMSWTAGGIRIRPAQELGIVRHLLAPNVNPDRALPRRPRRTAMGILVVIDPAKDLPGAVKEGEALVTELKKGTFDVRVLRQGEATVDAVRSAIADPSIDVFHYCGHAFYQGPDPDGSGLVCADGRLTLAEIRSISSVPRLAFVNACQAARLRGAQSSDEESQAFAEFFLRAGVDAYLGTFWLVSDEGAASFATRVYSALAEGAVLGDAVVQGRKALIDAENSDWANYVLFGHADFRLVQGGNEASTIEATALPASSYRLDGTLIVASWTFARPLAPASFTVVVVERDGGAPVQLSTPMRVERRETLAGTIATTTWVVTVVLAESLTYSLQLRPSDGDAIVVPAATRTLPAPRATDRLSRIESLLQLLDQQPDQGRAFLQALVPSAPPDELRLWLESERLATDTRALWPFTALAPAKVDQLALAEFVQANGLRGIDRDEAARQNFQTKEDWAAYAFAPGAIAFTVGADVRAPIWRSLPNPVVELTHELRDEEFESSIEVALFSDNGNGLHPALSIVEQIANSKLPYAFYLGDVYYSGTQAEFSEYFEQPVRPMLPHTELFMLAGNHEMYAGGTWFQDFVARKAAEFSAKQRQRGEMFRLRGPGFQLIGIDTMFVGWDSARVRLHDRADEGVLAVLNAWLAEKPDDFTVLMTTNEPWDLGSKQTSPLYESLRRTIAGRVDLWFWGNVHYAALFEPWAFTDVGSPKRAVVSSCIGHGGYPFYTNKKDDAKTLPVGLKCRWLETKSRFWPDPRIRPEVGANGWCRMRLERTAAGWDVKLTYIDWVGRERLRVNLSRADGASIRVDRVDESDQPVVGAPLVWKELT